MMVRRAWWHPMTVIQGTVDSLSGNRILLAIVAGIFLLGLVLAGTLTFLLWPRSVSISFVDLEHDTSPQPYRPIPSAGGIHLRVQSWINVDVRNPNFFGAKIKSSQVIASWMTQAGRKEMFGGSIIDTETLLKKREVLRLRLPVTIEYMGLPMSDPIYGDFLERCYFRSEGKGGEIALEWEVQVVTEAKGVERTGVITVDRTMACPIGHDMIEAALGKLGVDPTKERRRD